MVRRRCPEGEVLAMQHKPYFVDYFAYFGEVDHETFSTFGEMQFFMRQLRPGAVLDYGETQSQQGVEKKVAA
jgi:hypothetical protein